MLLCHNIAIWCFPNLEPGNVKVRFGVFKVQPAFAEWANRWCT